MVAGTAADSLGSDLHVAPMMMVLVSILEIIYMRPKLIEVINQMYLTKQHEQEVFEII